MGMKTSVTKYGLEKLIDYAYKDPEHNLGVLLDWADRFSGGNLEVQRRTIRDVVENPENPYHSFVFRIIRDVDPAQVKKVGVNFFVNEAMEGWARQEEVREKYNCNVPWLILMDPTSACNLHCTGCWAAEYGNKLNLSLEEMDDVICQGKDMGVYFYLFTGGEPLVRKNDIIKLCEKHDDCVFLAFTNGTLIDEKFADEMFRVKNFLPAISLEGDEFATDSRRGNGVYNKVIHAMELLKERHLAYGISACYTKANYESISSEEFIDKIIELGAYYIWYFHYMPVGNDATPELLLTPEQRVGMYHRIRGFRNSGKEIFAMDFQNDGEFVGGCVAGGRRYFHINANGDIDPCVFVHYSDSNIREKTILEAMQSPMFMAYHDGQPFNENMLQPCPMLENPQKLREMVARTGAHSTDMQSPESVEHLCEKCDQYAEHWAPVAAQLWEERQIERAENQRKREEEAQAAAQEKAQSKRKKKKIS